MEFVNPVHQIGEGDGFFIQYWNMDSRDVSHPECHMGIGFIQLVLVGLSDKACDLVIC